MSYKQTRAASQPTKMLEAHLEEGALCSFDGPGGAPRRCFAAQRTSWPASFSPSSSPCDCSKKKSARAYGRNGSVCVQSLHYSSHLLTMFNRGNYFFICSYWCGRRMCCQQSSRKRGSDEKARPSSASHHPFSVKFCVRLIWHQASSLVSAPAALCMERFSFLSLAVLMQLWSSFGTSAKECQWHPRRYLLCRPHPVPTSVVFLMFVGAARRLPPYCAGNF